jgi:hypothetical protein
MRGPGSVRSYPWMPPDARTRAWSITCRLPASAPGYTYNYQLRVKIRIISYKVIMGVRSCAARLAIFTPVTGGGSLLLSATSPVMGISSRADRVYQQS